MSSLEIRSICKSFGTTEVLKSIDISIESGEFLVLVGTFAEDIPLALAAIPGAVLAAAYMLRMLQKVIWGGTENPDQSWITDLNTREIITLAPFLLFVLWIGLSPGPFMEMMDLSVTELLSEFNAYKEHSVAAAEIMATR